MDLTTVLQNAQNPNLEIRTQAEDYLNQAVLNQYGPFLLALCIEFATEGKPEMNRILAGLYIKNLITAKDEAILNQKISQWVECDNMIKDQVKAGLLEAIKSPVKSIGRTAAQVLAAYGAVDIPSNNWPTLLESLFNNIVSPTIPDTCKVSSLEALGYMCDAMDPSKVSVAVVNQILTCIIDGMREDRSNDIRLAAISALNNSLAFTENNFKVDAERNTIMTSICNCTQCADVQVRSEAFSALATIADLYYDLLPPYVDTLFQLSTTAITTDDTSVGMYAIEFWVTVADNEYDKMQDIAEGVSETEVGVNFKITEQATPSIVPLMLECMTKQNEDDDEEWNIAKAAASCLESISRVVGDCIVDHVIPFLTQNIIQTNWRQKEAAIAVFGLILDGPSSEKMHAFIAQILQLLLNSMKDESRMVRDSATWTIGRILSFHFSCVHKEMLGAIVRALAEACVDPIATISRQACVSIFNLAECFEVEADLKTHGLSPYMQELLWVLINISTRDIGDQESIIKDIFEAIIKLIEISAEDCRPLIIQVLEQSLKLLDASYGPQTTGQLVSAQNCLCTLIGEIVKKLEAEEVSSYANEIMRLLLHSIDQNRNAVSREDAFVAIGPVADKLGPSFITYMSYIQPIIISALKNMEEYQLCVISVELFGDICRALGKGVLQFCDDIMLCLLELIQSQTLNRSVKPHVISVFSDIAMAIEGDFERYCAVIMGILIQAGTVDNNSDDEDLIDYINFLRVSILEAYTGIVLGLKEANKQDLIWPTMERVVEFLNRCATDDNKSEQILMNTLGLLSDLGQSYGVKFFPVYNLPFVKKLFEEAESSGDDKLSNMASTTKQVIFAIQAESKKKGN